MPDIAYKTPSGETRYRHITSSQQRLMAKMKWEDTVKRAREAKAPQRWVFTFGSEHRHPTTGESLFRNCVVLEGTWNETRWTMYKHFGAKWSMQYPTEEAAGVERYGLERIDLPSIQTHAKDTDYTIGPGRADSTEPPLPARPYLGRLGKLDSLPMREQAAIAITVAARKEKKPHLFCDGAKECLWQTRSAGAVDDGVRIRCPRHGGSK